MWGVCVCVCVWGGVFLHTSYGASQLPEDPFEIIQITPGTPKPDGELLQRQLQQADEKDVYTYT